MILAELFVLLLGSFLLKISNITEKKVLALFKTDIVFFLVYTRKKNLKIDRRIMTKKEFKRFLRKIV